MTTSRAVLLRKAARIEADALAILDALAPERAHDPGHRDWPTGVAMDLGGHVDDAVKAARGLRRVIETVTGREKEESVKL